MGDSPEKQIAAGRSVISAAEIDFSGDAIRFKVLTGNIVFTIINPILDRVVMVELSGIFTVGLPATVDVINGAYLPNLGKNYLYLHCIDESTPAYTGSWATGV
jgi:hypothetical protein